MGELDRADRLLDQARLLRADVVLLDANMPGRDPMEAMNELARLLPQARTLVFSAHDDRRFMDHAMEAGAWGCVSKNDEPQRIIEAVREAAAGNGAFGRNR